MLPTFKDLQSLDPHFSNTFPVICNAMRTVHKFEITVNTKNLSDEKIKFPMQN